MKHVRMTLSIAFAILTILSSANIAIALEGDLDTAFKTGVTWRGGTVNDVAVQPDGKIIIGGWFTVVDGRSYNCLARLNSNGTIDTTFAIGVGASLGQTVVCNGGVNAVALQADGKILIGGDFSTFGTSDPSHIRSNLARLNPNGSLDTSFIGVIPGTGPSGIVDDIVVQPDGKILIASFNTTVYSGSTVGYFARINIDGTLDTSFNTNLGTGFQNSTKKIALQADGKILVGGNFTSVNGTASHGIARLNANGSVDTAFSTALGSGLDSGVVTGIALQSDGKILICGGFFALNGTTRWGIGRLLSDGSLDGSFSSPVANDRLPETVIIQPDGKIVLSGGETQFNDGTNQRNSVVRLNPANGSIDPSFSVGSGINGTAPAIFLQGDGKILVGGGFTSVSDLARLSLVRFGTTGSVESTFTPVVGMPGTVKAIAVQQDNKVLLGGDFYGANSSLRPRLTRLNPDGTTDVTFNPGSNDVLADNEITAIAIQPNGKILIGGSFSSYGGQTAHAGIARLNYDGSLDNTFNASTFGVNSIAVQPDGRIVIGGLFDAVNGEFGHSRIARLNADGTLDASFTSTGAACNCGIQKVVVQPDGKIIAGGYFDQFNGSNNINNLVRLNTNGSIDVAFTSAGGTGFNGSVNDIDLQPADNKIIVTGWFSAYNVTSSAGIARLASSGSYDGSFSVGTGFGGGPSDLALLPNGSMVVVGSFGSYQDVVRNRIVRISQNGQIDLNLNAGFGGGASAAAFQSSGRIIVGGGFATYGDAYGIGRIGVLRLRSGSNQSLFRAPFDFDGDGKTDISIFRPTLGQWWWERSSDTVVNSAPFAAAGDKIIPADFTGDGLTDIAVWRPSSANWFVLRSEDSSFYAFPFGSSGDSPAPSDYDGDGKADAAVFRPSLGLWFVMRSSDGLVSIIPFGNISDKAVPADYDGDGRADVAIFRPASGQWWINRSSAGVIANTFGVSTDRPVPGDYTGDGKADLAFWRPSTGEWFVLRSEDSSFYSFPFGGAGDIPSPGDFDGDGRFDAAIFHTADASWWINGTTSGIVVRSFGQSTDLPVPNAFVP